MSFLILALSIYWGAFSHAEKNLATLKIFVVDFDGQPPYDTEPYEPIVGPAITELARQQLASTQAHLGYEFPPLSQFQHDPIEVRRAVYDWDAWAAVIINSNATAMLHSAISTGNASYDPLGACQLVYQSARDNTNWFDFIYPNLSPFLTLVTSTVGEQWAKTVLQNATGNNAVIESAANVPQALNPAIGFSEYDLRPFYPYTAVPAVSIGLIYLIILSFFSFSFYLPIHFKVRGSR